MRSPTGTLPVDWSVAFRYVGEDFTDRPTDEELFTTQRNKLRGDPGAVWQEGERPDSARRSPFPARAPCPVLPWRPLRNDRCSRPVVRRARARPADRRMRRDVRPLDGRGRRDLPTAATARAGGSRELMAAYGTSSTGRPDRRASRNPSPGRSAPRSPRRCRPPTITRLASYSSAARSSA